jgi:N-acetylmuramoyl-L-alanine amidase
LALAASSAKTGQIAAQASKTAGQQPSPAPASTAEKPAEHVQATQSAISQPIPGSGVVPRAARFIVVLDAAHGGEDDGAKLGGTTAEKTVTLDLSVRLRSLLTARGFQVVTTREANVDLDSDARAQIVNHASYGFGSAACIVLHATRAGSGVHLFVSALSPSTPTRFLAWKTAQAGYVTRSLQLASAVNSALERSAGGDDTNAATIPVTLGRASLPGMDSMTCPAVAVEVAPIRGADRKVVTDVADPQYETQIVEALATAVLAWKSDSMPDAHPAGERP